MTHPSPLSLREAIERLRAELPRVGEPEHVWCMVRGYDLRAAVDALSQEAATPLTAPVASEAIRLAYKTGYDEGYSDASDGLVDHDACEEGWQQYSAALATPPQTPSPAEEDFDTLLFFAAWAHERLKHTQLMAEEQEQMDAVNRIVQGGAV